MSGVLINVTFAKIVICTSVNSFDEDVTWSGAVTSKSSGA